MAPYGFGLQDTTGYLAGREAAAKFYREAGFDEGTFKELDCQWGEMDANGHVNNVTFARYFESGRLAFWRHLASQVSPEAAVFITGGHNKSKGQILAAVSIDYLAPVFAPDVVLVAHRVSSFSEKRVTLEASLYSYGQKKKVARGTSTMVAYDYGAGKPMNLPQEIIEWLKKNAAEGNPGSAGGTRDGKAKL